MADQPVAQPVPKTRVRLVLRMAKQAGLIALFLLVALVGTVSGVLFAYAGDLPEISALDEYRPNTITRLLARDGREIGTFATERRVVIGYDDMAPRLRQAIIATEDAGFERHFGLSIKDTARAVALDLLTGERKGASTITQQVARDLFLRQYMRQGGVYARSGLEGLERKVKEWLVSLKIERRYTKREIFTLYANQMYLGHGAYGVEAASHLYFDKPAKDLALEEAAVIAGIIQSPERLSPFADPTRCLARRNQVLQRMEEEHYLTAQEAQDAQARPLVLQGQPTPDRSVAPYFVEDIRKGLEQKYGAKALYEAGLRVQTTLDADLQEAANVAVERGLRKLDKRRSGYRKPARNVVADPRTVLLTGGNGYLGRFLALEWLQRLSHTGGKLIAVVRGVDADAALARLESVFDSGDPRLLAQFRALAAEHLEVMPGDIGEPNLGLDDATWRELAQRVDLIVHPAALVNHVLPYRQMFGPNVVGTAEVIRLAITTRIKPVTYLSTLSPFSSRNRSPWR